MFIFKYALKSISRSLGRNILIGIIVFIIATAACVAMSIQQAAETAAKNRLAEMNISAQLNIDRGYIYTKASQNANTTDMSVLMPEMNSLMKEYSLDLDGMEEYRDIKKSDSDESIVKNFYYNSSISINGSGIEKYDLTSSSQETTSATEATTTEVQKMTDPAGNEVETPTMPQMEQQEPQQMEKNGDFTLTGYDSYAAMEVMADFGSSEDDDKTCKITQGSVFDDNTTDYVCLIEDNLATFNNLSVGDKFSLVNPKNEDETYEFEISGIYKNSSGSSADGTDPANVIITSYKVVKDIEEKSETTNAAASTSSDSDSKTESTTAATTAETTAETTSASGSSDSSSDEESNALISQFTGTFVFGSVDDYNQFKEAVKNKAKESGQDEDMYIVTSSDVATFKAGLKPLENLKSFATTFLYLTLAIGAIVLIVISVISIRDRKYEIGALAAMGLKKLRLSMMFMIEVLTVTLVAILIGAVAGSVASVPVTSYLLSAQVEQQQTADSSKQQQPGMPGGNMERPDDGEVDTSKVEYVTADDIGFSVDIFVILKMLAIGVVLAIVSGFTSILFILRYDPKQILANRD